MRTMRIFLCVLLLAAAPARATSHVILVQNSGWMEPFYGDPASPFKPLVAAIAGVAVQPGEPVVLAAFNQSRPGAPSPAALLSVRAGEDFGRQVAQALQPLAPARKAGGTLADTDMGEALTAAMRDALGGQPGLVWLFTNNRNSPNNDQATAQRNREFYQLVHQGGAIARAVAFPLHMPVQGAQYHANGLMVYVFGVGEAGGRALDALLASGRLRSVITEPPARLKPLDSASVRLVPRRVEQESEGAVEFSMAPDGTMLADVSPGARQAQARVQWQLENTMYPYVIERASLAAQSVLAGQSRPLALGQKAVQRLAPGAQIPLASTLELPVAQMPSAWSMQALAAAGSAHVLPGRLELRLEGQQLALSPAFRKRMADLFPGDPLPDIFTPPATIHGSTAVLPIEVRVHYGVAPLALLIGGVAALLASAGAATWATGRARKIALVVDGEPRTLYTRAGEILPILDNTGREAGRLQTTRFSHRLLDAREGVRLGS